MKEPKTVYGKLELKEIDFATEGEEYLTKDNVIYTILEFSELTEFKIDKLYKVMQLNYRKNKCEDCEFSYDALIASNDDEILLSVAQFVKTNIIEAKELNLMESIYMFFTFYYHFTEFRNNFKKKSSQSLMETSQN